MPNYVRDRGRAGARALPHESALLETAVDHYITRSAGNRVHQQSAGTEAGPKVGFRSAKAWSARRWHGSSSRSRLSLREGMARKARARMLVPKTAFAPRNHGPQRAGKE